MSSQRLRHELFEVVLPFWERYGFDPERGGFFCGLDHDGRRVHDRKFDWFQGRGLWIYSFLAANFGQGFELARKTRDLVLAEAPGYSFWGRFFAVEGLQEWSALASDAVALDEAIGLLHGLWRETPPTPAQDVWMLNLRVATQMLRRWDLPDVARAADRALGAVLEEHYNPATGLNMERREQPELCVIGHSIECLWMAMDEALRRGDDGLFDLAATRLRRHIEAGWDPEYGGLAQAVHVGHPEYEWPVDVPVETGLAFRSRGEFHWMKSFWAVNELQIGALMVWEHRREPWAWEWFERAQQVVDEKFSLRARGYPLYLLFTDRTFPFQPHSQRQDNYHLPRALMLNLLALERCGLH